MHFNVLRDLTVYLAPVAQLANAGGIIQFQLQAIGKHLLNAGHEIKPVQTSDDWVIQTNGLPCWKACIRGYEGSQRISKESAKASAKADSKSSEHAGGQLKLHWCTRQKRPSRLSFSYGQRNNFD
jgi:hypothetical protein